MSSPAIARKSAVPVEKPVSMRNAAKIRLFRPATASTPTPPIEKPLRGVRGSTPLSLRKLWGVLQEDECQRIAAIMRRDAKPFPLTEIIETNPYRPPDWRWQLGLRWAADQPRWPAELQALAEPAVRLLAATAVKRTLFSLPPWIGADHRLVQAYEWIVKPPAPWLRETLQLLILANVPPHEIASETGVHLEVVCRFETLFFDVRSRLEFPSAIVHTAIGFPSDQEPLEQALARERRRLAYAFGPEVARELIRESSPWPLVSRNTCDVRAILDEAMKANLLANLALLVRTLRLDTPEELIQLLKLWITRQKQAARKERKRREHDDLNKGSNWEAALKAMKAGFQSPLPQITEFQAKAARIKG